jgi:hypothetical protein
MSENRRKPGFVVLKQTGKDTWRVVGEADRRPGLTARKARAQAIEDATHGKPKTDEVYRVILKSEWAIGLD